MFYKQVERPTLAGLVEGVAAHLQEHSITRDYTLAAQRLTGMPSPQRGRARLRQRATISLRPIFGALLRWWQARSALAADTALAFALRSSLEGNASSPRVRRKLVTHDRSQG